MTFSWESQNVSRRKCFVTEISRNVITHLDEILELLGDPDHEEPGGEVELGLGESPLTPGLPALGRHPAEERDLEMEEFYEVERVMLRKYQHRQRPSWYCANIAKLSRHLNPHPPGLAVRGQAPGHTLVEGGGVALLGPDLVHQDVIPVPDIVMIVMMMMILEIQSTWGSSNVTRASLADLSPCWCKLEWDPLQPLKLYVFLHSNLYKLTFWGQSMQNVRGREREDHSTLTYSGRALSDL